MEEKILIKGKFKSSPIFALAAAIAAALFALTGILCVPYLTIIWFVPAIFVIVFFISPKKYELVVTDKRVYGKTLTKRVDLPFDSITSTSVTTNGTVVISTPSGVIKFGYCENKDDVHKVISQHLVERQNNQNIAVPVVPSSAADELKKYKELLDMGAITQQEYDEKKKQLLGL